MSTTKQSTKQINPAQAIAIIQIAQEHVGNGAAMASSARLSLDDALACLGRGEHFYAAKRALDSLGYSIGILHRHHADALAIFNA